jgi:PBP1b-binding outer membrane lipoprotein LpoB
MTKSKLLSLLLLTPFLLVGCSSPSTYSSYYSAQASCNNWKKKEVKINLTSEKVSGERQCLKDDETNQVLGMQSVEADDENGLTKMKMEVKENFRY